jgi:hypothetical protein
VLCAPSPLLSCCVRHRPCSRAICAALIRSASHPAYSATCLHFKSFFAAPLCSLEALFAATPASMSRAPASHPALNAVVILPLSMPLLLFMYWYTYLSQLTASSSLHDHHRPEFPRRLLLQESAPPPPSSSSESAQGSLPTAAVFVIAAVRCPPLPTSCSISRPLPPRPSQVCSVMGLFFIAIAVVHCRRSRANSVMVRSRRNCKPRFRTHSAAPAHASQTRELSVAAAANLKQKHMWAAARRPLFGFNH